MNRYIVCDAGGTKSEFILFDSSANIIASYRCGAANSLFMGNDEAVDAVCSGVWSCLERAGLALLDVTEIALFIPGFRQCLQALKDKLNYNAVSLDGDEEVALYGALGMGCGITVLSGTGSFAFGHDHTGTAAASGGWGPLIGDYGSGYHIGVLALAAVAKRYDMRRPAGILEQLILEKFGVSDIMEIRREIYIDTFSRQHMSDLCVTVAQAAKMGDTTALAVLDTAAVELVSLAKTVADRLNSDGLNVSLIGGVSKIGTLIVEPFKRYLTECLPQCSFVTAKFTPCIGGMLYLLEKREGCDITSEYIQNQAQKGVAAIC